MKTAHRIKADGKVYEKGQDYKGKHEAQLLAAGALEAPAPKAPPAEKKA